MVSRLDTPTQPETDDISLPNSFGARGALIVSLRAAIASLTDKNASLTTALINQASEINLLKRRLFGSKSERLGTNELQLILGDLLADEAALKKKIVALTGQDAANDPETPPPPETPPTPPVPPPAPPTPKGRRDLLASTLNKVVIEILDPALAAQGKLIGFDTSCELMIQRARTEVLVIKTAKYEVKVGGEKTVLGTAVPLRLLPRAMMHTSMLAWLAVQKFCLGVPHYRLEQHMALQGETLDRSTMCRNMEAMGNALGATIVAAMMRDAIENCCVLSTDATGAAVQPGPRNGGPKQACKKGHFFTIVADLDHVLFAYTEHHTQAFVAELFKGFRGFLQSDASNVYDVLERGPLDPTSAPTLVGCWAHMRRYFFDAAICKYAEAAGALFKIRDIYFADMQLAKLLPDARKLARTTKVMPLVDDFFADVKKQISECKAVARNKLSQALNYATNQEQELRNVFLDGRLPLDNTRSERALRKIVVGRKNWMFYGSDVHAQSAAALFSLAASCRLHTLDPESYLDEVMRVLPYWPKERYLELSPKLWKKTRERLVSTELASPLAKFTIPPPPD